MARKVAKRQASGATTDFLIEMLDAAYRTTGWHGPTLRSTIARVKLADAVARPNPKKHNIAEIALHCAYWKYVGIRRLAGAKRGGFALKGSNWFDFGDDKSDADWRDARTLLDETHDRLIETVSGLSEQDLVKVPQGAKVTNLKMIYGLAAHDAYHAGQIRWLRGLHQIG